MPFLLNSFHRSRPRRVRAFSFFRPGLGLAATFTLLAGGIAAPTQVFAEEGSQTRELPAPHRDKAETLEKLSRDAAKADNELSQEIAERSAGDSTESSEPSESTPSDPAPQSPTESAAADSPSDAQDWELPDLEEDEEEVDSQSSRESEEVAANQAPASEALDSEKSGSDSAESASLESGDSELDSSESERAELGNADLNSSNSPELAANASAPEDSAPESSQAKRGANEAEANGADPSAPPPSDDAADGTDAAQGTESEAVALLQDGSEEGEGEDAEGEEAKEEWRSYDVEGFVKGELTSLGTTKLLMQNTRFGVRLGVSKIHNSLYGLISPEFDLRIKKFGLGLQLPLRIRLYDNSKELFDGALFPDGFSGFRWEDYDEFSEILRVVRYLSYGSKEDNFYLNLSSESAVTIGHGGVVRRYLPNVDVDRGRLAAQFDAYGKYGGVETFVGDLLRPDSLFGVLAFAKPMGNSNELLLQRLSFGLHYTADLNAPYELDPTQDGVKGGGEAPTTPGVKQSLAAHVAGVSVETKVLKTQNVDLKPWIDVSWLFAPGSKELGARSSGSGGLTLGMLGRFNFAENEHAIRTIAEGRVFGGNYLPGYFDSTYQVQRFNYLTGKAKPNLETKLHDLLNRERDVHFGYYLEFQYAWVRNFAFTAAWEDSTAEGGTNLVLHLEVPTFKYLKLFTTLQQRSVARDQVFDIFRDTSGQLASDNTLIFAGARLRALPFLFFNARVYRAWQFDPSDQYRSYRNVEGFEIDMELGFEFGEKKKKG